MLSDAEQIIVYNDLLFVRDEISENIEIYNAFSPFTHVGTADAGMFNDVEHMVISEGYLYVSDGDDNNVEIFEIVNTIPTLGQWGLIILGLFLSIFGLVAIRQKSDEFA